MLINEDIDDTIQILISYNFKYICILCIDFLNTKLFVKYEDPFQYITLNIISDSNGNR